MLDIKVIKNDPERVKAAMRSRNADLDAVIDELLDIDAKRRDLTGKTEAMKAEQNAASKQIPALKKAGQSTDEIMQKMKVMMMAER